MPGIQPRVVAGEKPAALEASALLPRYPSRSCAPAESAGSASNNAAHGADPSAVEQADKDRFWQTDDAPHSPTMAQPNGVPEQHTFSVQTAPDGNAVLRKVDRHILPIFFSLALLCSIDRANLSYAALQLNHDLQFSHTVYGFGSGLFFLGYMVFQIPSTYVCARIGAPRFLGSILVVWGLVATLFAWMQTSAQFYTLRLILGLAESGAYPGMWYSLALFYDDKELGVAYTTVAMATSVSGVLGGPIAAGLLSLDGLGGLHGWQWLFLLEGVPAIALGIAIWCALAHSPDRAMFLAPEERVWLVKRRIKQSTVEATAAEEVRMDENLVVSQIAEAQQEVPFYQSWCIWYLGLVWTLVATGLDGIVFWGPILIHNILDMDSSSDSAGAADLTEDVQETGISTWATVQAALLSAIPFGLASVCMLINARLAKKAEERQWHGAVPLLLGAVALALMPAFMGHVTWLAFVCLSLAAAGIWAIHGPLLSWPAAILQGTNAAAGFALMKMMGSVGSFCGPFLIGALSDEYEGSFVPPVLLLSGFLLLASVLHFLFREPGSGQGLLPRFPYSCGRVMKRSRSDINTITLGPTLRRIFGTRELNFQRWSSNADAVEGRTIDNKPELHSTGQHPAAHLLEEDTFLWEKHSDLPRF